MALRISQSSLLEKKTLEVDSRGVTCVQTALVGGRKTYPFEKIEFVLMSPDRKLSIQSGEDVFSIQTNPKKARHKEVIDTLLRELRLKAGPP